MRAAEDLLKSLIQTFRVHEPSSNDVVVFLRSQIRVYPGDFVIYVQRKVFLNCDSSPFKFINFKLYFKLFSLTIEFLVKMNLLYGLIWIHQILDIFSQ